MICDVAFVQRTIMMHVWTPISIAFLRFFVSVFLDVAFS